MFGYAVVYLSNYFISRNDLLEAYFEYSFEDFLTFCSENDVSYSISLHFDSSAIPSSYYDDFFIFSVKVDSYGL